MMDYVRVAKAINVLRAGAKVLEQHGWVRETYSVAPTRELLCMCAAGALYYVATGVPRAPHPFEVLGNARTAADAIDLFHVAMGGNVLTFNDQLAKNKDEVITGLLFAADILESELL